MVSLTWVSVLPASPSEVLYIAEFNPNYGMGPKGFTAYDVWLPHLMPFNKLAPNSNPRMIHAEDDRHQGRTTIVFFDGQRDKNGLVSSMVSGMKFYREGEVDKSEWAE